MCKYASFCKWAVWEEYSCEWTEVVTNLLTLLQSWNFNNMFSKFKTVSKEIRFHRRKNKQKQSVIPTIVIPKQLHDAQMEWRKIPKTRFYVNNFSHQVMVLMERFLKLILFNHDNVFTLIKMLVQPEWKWTRERKKAQVACKLNKLCPFFVGCDHLFILCKHVDCIRIKYWITWMWYLSGGRQCKQCLLMAHSMP